MTGIEYTKSPSAYSGIGPRGHWRAKLGDVDVVRPTKKEAHDALLTLLSEIVSGSYQTEVISYQTDYLAIVYRKLEGWCYVVSDGTGRKPAEVQVGGKFSRAEAIITAKRHLAQMAYPMYNGLSLLESDSAATLSHLRWIAWQRAYEHAKSLDGMTDAKAHDYASVVGHPECWLTRSEIEIYWRLT